MAKLSTDQRIAQMTFASVYPHYVTKVQKKGKTVAELHLVIEWLTGFSNEEIESMIESKASFATFFERATLHENAHMITGLICGYRVENIENQLTQKVRYLDKLVDELARGKKMKSILRS